MGIIVLMRLDVAVIGGGPAGLSASIFSSRAGLSTICFEKLAIGGQASLSHNIENFPAFKSISGFDLAMKMFEQAKETGTQFVFSGVKKIKKTKLGFSIETSKEKYFAKKLVIACGNVARKLGINEEQFIGRGVSYCASCDGNFFKGKNVAIVGGGDSAFVYAEYLSKLVNQVYLINRTDKFRAQPYRVERVKNLSNVKILINSQIEKLQGDKQLSSIVISGKKKQELEVEGLFVAIGHVPDLDFLDFEIEVDKNGYIVTDRFMKTSVENVFACGDIVSKHFKQVITACADGAIAGNSCVGD